MPPGLFTLPPQGGEAEVDAPDLTEPSFVLCAGSLYGAVMAAAQHRRVRDRAFKASQPSRVGLAVWRVLLAVGHAAGAPHAGLRTARQARPGTGHIWPVAASAGPRVREAARHPGMTTIPDPDH
jgi:hypothetical protein